jgi:uncharacterized RDD family membrane protein YckC
MPTTIDLPPLRGGRTIDDRLQRAELYDGVLARRIFACLIDWMVLFCLIVLGHLATCTTAVLTFGTLTPLMIISVALLPIIYGTWTIGGRASATPGMRAMDLTVRNWQGQRPDFPQALLMTILFYATVVPTSGFVLLVALFDRRLRCLHDLLSGVVVVRRSFLEFRG